MKVGPMLGVQRYQRCTLNSDLLPSDAKMMLDLEEVLEDSWSAIV